MLIHFLLLSSAGTTDSPFCRIGAAGFQPIDIISFHSELLAEAVSGMLRDKWSRALLTPTVSPCFGVFGVHLPNFIGSRVVSAQIYPFLSYICCLSSFVSPSCCWYAAADVQFAMNSYHRCEKKNIFCSILLHSGMYMCISEIAIKI